MKIKIIKELERQKKKKQIPFCSTSQTICPARLGKARSAITIRRLAESDSRGFPPTAMITIDRAVSQASKSQQGDLRYFYIFKAKEMKLIYIF